MAANMISKGNEQKQQEEVALQKNLLDIAQARAQQVGHQQPYGKIMDDATVDASQRERARKEEKNDIGSMLQAYQSVSGGKSGGGGGSGTDDDDDIWGSLAGLFGSS